MNRKLKSEQDLGSNCYVQSGFTQIPNTIINLNQISDPSIKLSPNALLILILLASFCFRKSDPKVYPSGDRLCEMSGFSSLTTITKATKELEAKGWIYKSSGKVGRQTQFRRNIYDLTPYFARAGSQFLEISSQNRSAADDDF